ncbi:MAG TPA: aminotransferase class I/II-fold pyridoxal phosphate-dependent enzyme, partial [Terriglobales bacterium]
MTLSRRSFLGTLGAASTLTAMTPWQALASPEPQRVRRAAGSDMALLNSNENAYGMFASAQKAAMNAVSSANRYPEPWELMERLTAYHKLKQGQVITGYGSSEHIAMAMHAFTGPGRKLVTANPTFELAAMHAKMLGVQVVTVPLMSSYAHDLDGMLAKIGSDTGLVYICNPNNPTASITPRRD